jgi:hypothetical protein
VIGLVGVAEGDGVLVVEHLVATLPERCRHTLLGQQFVRVGYQSEPIYARWELCEDLVSPAH